MTELRPPRESDLPWHALPVAEALQRLAAGDDGLRSDEAESRLLRHGRNSLPSAPRRPMWRRLLAQFDSVLIYVLLAAAAITLWLGHTLDATVIAAVVLINALVGFVQEGRAEQALAAVSRMLAPQTSVLRDGKRATLAAELLVPGDVVLLEAGDHVPADLRLLRARNLRIEEAALTGESLAVEKSTEPAAADAALGDRRSMAYAGTMVVAGQGRGLVVAGGSATELGRISGMLSQIVSLDTPLLRQVNQFGSRLTVVIVVVCALVFALTTVLGHFPADQAFLAVVGIAVAAIPEGLPVLITITLALGVQRMAGRRAIVRQLPAVETLGAVSVICSDKTGTLTRNEMTVGVLATTAAEYTVDGGGYAPIGALHILHDGAADADRDGVLALARAAWLCNDAALHQAEDGWRIEGDPMEAALKVLALKAGVDGAALAIQWPRRDEIPFDAAHRYMATLHGAASASSALLCVKGAPEQIIALCGRQRSAAGDHPIDRGRWHERVEALAAQGQRVLALAEARLPGSQQQLGASVQQGQPVLLGLVGLIDPPREEAREAIAECVTAGIRVKMITGDHVATARAIAAQLGLQNSRDALTGAEVDALDAAQLQARVADVDVFARTSPENKLRLVEALQAGGALVAMTGDGVNDAPALKRADIGVAMGIKGTEAAKQAAKIVLADDNFATIVAAVREGRTIHDNISKSIRWTLPTNGGESLVILVALLFGLTLPITAVQILWINMVTTITLGLTFAFEPAEPDVMRGAPRAAGQSLLSPFVLWRVLLVSVLFAIGAFGMFWWAEQRGMTLEYARTLVVNTIVVLEIFYLFSNRFLSRSSLDWRGVLGTPAVLSALALIVLLQFAFTYAPFMQWAFATGSITLADGLLTIAVGVLLLTLLETEKWLVRAWRRRRPTPAQSASGESR
jgi:magnesium-transporting ATPase (P-type)